MASADRVREMVERSLRVFGLSLPLRPHQVDAILRFFTPGRLDSKHGALLADEMGLGKTITSIAIALMAQKYVGQGRAGEGEGEGEGGARPSLVAVPTPLADQWRQEIARAVEGAEVHIYRGAAREKTFPSPPPQFVVATYDAIKADWRRAAAVSSPPRGTIWDVRWASIIADEAHDFRNPRTKLAQAMMFLSARADFPLALTGTPVNNGTEDAKTLMAFCKCASPSDAIIRRKRADVFTDVDLPPAEAHVIYHPLEEGEIAVHDAVLAKISSSMRFADVLVALLRARQVCVSPALAVEGCAGRATSRLAIVASIVRDAVEEKKERVIVFSQWARALREAKAVCEMLAPGIRGAVFDGSLSQAERCSVLRDLSSGVLDVLWTSYAVGNKGLNITTANHVVLMDPWWNPFVEDQAVARCHRLGQTKTVHVYRMVARATFEDYMCRVIQPQKRKASQAVLCETEADEGGEALAAGFSRKDLERAMGFMKACAARHFQRMKSHAV